MGSLEFWSTLISGCLMGLSKLASILKEFSWRKSMLGETLYSPKDFWTVDLIIAYIDFSDVCWNPEY